MILGDLKAQYRNAAVQYIEPKIKMDLTGTEFVKVLGAGASHRERMIKTLAEHARDGLDADEAAMILGDLKAQYRNAAIVALEPRIKYGLTGEEFQKVVGSESGVSRGASIKTLLEHFGKKPDKHVEVLPSTSQKPSVSQMASNHSTSSSSGLYQGPPNPGSPLVSYQAVTQEFGVPWSANPAQVHTGVDLATPKGNLVYAVKDSEIVKVGSLGGDWGQYIIAENQDGTYSGYLHVVPYESSGNVVRGEPIGTIYKDHLHFNSCKQLAGCQHGAFPSPTYPNMAVSEVTKYYTKPFLQGGKEQN
jgi:murein DD-endopeptidase MepM/ murein hydrolase activator NlpD